MGPPRLGRRQKPQRVSAHSTVKASSLFSNRKNYPTTLVKLPFLSLSLFFPSSLTAVFHKSVLVACSQRACEHCVSGLIWKSNQAILWSKGWIWG